MSKTYDSEQSLKAKVIQRLRDSRRFGSKPVVATEYCVGATGVRADLVIASRTTREIAVIEIKSAADSLKRLPHQLDGYARYFDHIILVAAHRHQPHVRQLSIPGLEIWEVEKSGALATVRPSDAAPRSESLADLLTQREKARYRGLLQQGAEGVRDAFFASFEDRHGETSNQFWGGVSSRVSVANLAALSRFETERADEKLKLIVEAERYSSWEGLVAA